MTAEGTRSTRISNAPIIPPILWRPHRQTRHAQLERCRFGRRKRGIAEEKAAILSSRPQPKSAELAT